MPRRTDRPERVNDPRRFQLLVNGLVDYAIYMLDADGRVTSWNAGAARITRYAAAEILGENFARFFPPEDRAAGRPETALRRAREEGRFEAEAWRLRKDGSRFWAHAVIDPIHDEAGRFVGYAEIARDMSERRVTRAALVPSEEQFRVLVEGVLDYAVFMLDPGGYVASWNPGARRIKGYTAEEIIGQHFSLFYTPEDRARGEPERLLAIAATEGKSEHEGWRLRKDGSRFWASVVLDAIRDENGRLIGYAKITRDITERKQSQDALEETRAALMQSQKMEAVGRLTGGVAHDFNNLLTVIINNLDLLSQLPDDPQRMRRLIGGAQRAAERGAKLTQQLLAFARRQPLRPAPHDVNALLGGFEAVLRRAGGEMLDIRLDLAPRLDPVEIDAPQFEAAILNLVVNARDATPHGGLLSIRTRVVEMDARPPSSSVEPGPYVAVSVSDNGEGMSVETRARAFEPFFTTKEAGKGSGLGLSQVYGFVSQTGGHVELESTPGQGTIVTLYLPAKAGKVGAEPRDEWAERRLPGIATVLVVEDDPDVLETAVETLRSLGYEVLTAADGPSALDTLGREPEIDILFTDIVMPGGMDGLELARRAATLRPGLKVLLASGYPMTALSALHGLSTEFAFLRKPYRWSELAEKLRRVRAA